MARLAFLGSPDAAVPSLRALREAGHEITLVVSQPDKRRGRGAASAPSPVKRAALDAGLRVTDRTADVVASGAELGVVVAYGRLVRRGVLESMPMINAHFSLLPRWRGAAPVERAILAGDRVSGVSIMRLEEGLDTGPVLVARPEPIRHDRREHASALTGRLADIAAEMLVELLSGGVAMLGPGKTQVGEVTYAAKLEPDELHLDFLRTTVELERVVRLDRAWTTFRAQRLLVLDAVGHSARDRLIPLSSERAAVPDPAGGEGGGKRPREQAAPHDEPRAGTLRGTHVRVADGELELLVVQPAGRRPMPAAEWVRGARPGTGERLGD